jgi:hypothetical protein
MADKMILENKNLRLCAPFRPEEGNSLSPPKRARTYKMVENFPHLHQTTLKMVQTSIANF